MDACFLPRAFLVIIIIIIIIPATSWASSFASAATSSSASTADGASLSKAMVAWKVNFSSWVGGDPCQDWQGVICNDNDRVISLNLSNKGLVGPIPQEISKLQYLITLDLSNPRHANPPLNQITGDLSALEGLTNLQILNLTFNNIHLDAFPSVVFNLTNLIALMIDNNYLNGALPKELAQLTKLEYLYLGNNSLSGPIPSEFGNLVNLRELSLWNNNLNSKIPPELGNLVNLTYLNLHSCNLYGGLPSELGNLTNIRNLSLYENSLTGIAPDAWSKMENLKVLLLYNNYLTKYFPEWINELPNLLNVSLAYNLFYGSVPNFTGTTSVQNVSLTCNFFSGTAPTAPQTMILNYSGNCFNNSDANEKIKCAQAYFDCEDFLNSVQNGSCPRCPSSQVLEDASTCVCTLDDGTGGGGGSKRWELVGSILGVGGFLILVGFIWWMWSRSRKRSGEAAARYHGRFHEIQGSISGRWEGPEEVVRFNLQELVNATENFHTRHEIGIGGFGKVFYAVLEGRKVAIKRAHLSSIQSSSGFRNEVLLLSRLHHKNLVHLLGFCEDEGIQILVYEFMPNGNLHTLLFRDGNTLDWLKRLDIAIGVAQGLEYLHSFADPPVIHRDVKPSNILLDENLVAKLSDFGISKVAPGFETHFATRPAGTVGYIDPQYILREQLTTASDVYSFGMVLLELISGQKSVDNTRLDEHNLVEWVKLKLNTEGLECIVDSRLGDRYPKQVYQDIVRLAIDCASFKSEDRPSMKAVVTILDACRWSVSPHLLEVPNDMQEFSQEHVSEADFSASQSSDRVLAKAMERSITEGSRNTFSVSLLLPR